jgi:phage tail-like protein
VGEGREQYFQFFIVQSSFKSEERLMPSVLVPYAQLDSILEEFNDELLWFVVMNPEIGEENVAKDENIVIRAVLPQEDPALADLSTLSIIIQVEKGSGWETVFDGQTFTAPWDSASTITDSTGVSPYTFREVACIPGEDVFLDSSTVQVRVAATNNLPAVGWGAFNWGSGSWGSGYAGGTVEGSASFSFGIIDETVPRAVLVEAIDRTTIRVTYSESMAPSTLDGGARVSSTIVSGSWPAASTLPWEFQIVINGTQYIATIDETMVSGPVVTDEEVSFSLDAQLDGVSAVLESGIITLVTVKMGDNATLQVVGGNGATNLGFPDTEAVGAYRGVLDAANYQINRHNVFPNPAVNLTVESVVFAPESDYQVDLTVQWAMTFNGPYRLHIDGDVMDEFGNVIDSGTLEHDFSGYTPQWDERRDTEIRLPDVIWQHDSELVMRALINCWQEFFNQLIADLDETWDLMSPDNLPDELLTLALRDMGNPFEHWSGLDLDEEEQRRLLDLLPAIYESKGLAPGIESAIYLLLGIPVQVEPYTSEGWRLGIDVLGDSYPATVRSTKYAPYDLSGFKTLTVEINEGDPQTIVFDENDFVDPFAATEKETVAAISSALDGGGAEPIDDSTGKRFVIFSEYYGPGGAIQVTGGTANFEFGFDLTLHSSSGGCRLAPGDLRSQLTFDLVYGDVLPSEEQLVLIRRIARYMKAAREFVGNIRPIKVYESTDKWRLGRGYLGLDTVVG